ncbi:MAG: nucleoside kinase [Rikenellaceae bacterium]
MNDNLFKVKCDNNSMELFVKPGTTLLEIIDMLNLSGPYPFIAAYVNNVVKDLNYNIYENKNVKFIDILHFEGVRVYERTLYFMLYKAVRDLYPDCELNILQSVSRGSYFEISGVENSDKVATDLKNRLAQISKLNMPILRDRIHYKEAEKIYADNKMYDKSRLLESSPSLYVTINMLGNVFGYFYGTLAPSTGYVSLFDIEPFYNGFYLSAPHREDPQHLLPFAGSSKYFDVMLRNKELLDVLNVPDVGSLNSLINSGQSKELIKIGEAFQEKNFAHLADEVYQKCEEGVKVVLISGPSSSGKTTFSNRLNIQLKIFGLKPLILSMDNYFVDRDKTPLDAKGNHDYEVVEALDIELFNDHLQRLIAGEEVEVPKYSFTEGHRKWDGTKFMLKSRGILIIEGIHALNPRLTESVEKDKKYKIYVSPLTSISLDNMSRINTTDIRLMRRIVRDSAFRNHSALQTLKRWGSVRRGEEKNILPFQNNADTLFNTSLFFELPVLKLYVEPLLNAVSDLSEEYSEANRLLNILSNIVAIEHKWIPSTSIIREFIGGSSFDY